MSHLLQLTSLRLLSVLEGFGGILPGRTSQSQSRLTLLAPIKAELSLAMPEGKKPTELRVISFMLLHGKVGRSLYFVFF